MNNTRYFNIILASSLTRNSRIKSIIIILCKHRFPRHLPHFYFLLTHPARCLTFKFSFPEQLMKEDGPLFKFYEIMKDSEYGNQFLNTLTRMGSGTLFAPSNAAWQDDNIRNILLNSDKMRDILNLHLVKDQRLSVERIKQNINQQVI